MVTPAQVAAIATIVRAAVPSALWISPASDPPVRAPYRTVVTDKPTDDALEVQRDLDTRTPGFSTAVDLEHEPGASSPDGLSDLITRTPGATVRSIGGLGQFGAVSLRGSSPQQVGVFLDGVPLTSSIAGLFDLSSLSIDGLSRLEIYRGYVPVAFGSAAMGGAIDLVGSPAWHRTGLTINAGYGSFGARHSRITLQGPLGSHDRSAGALTLSYAGATGDFPFYDDNGTPDLGDDDRTTLRSGNDYDRITVHSRFDLRWGQWRIALQELLQYKNQGIPGPASAQARAVRLRTLNSRSVATLRRYGWGGPGGRLEWLAGIGLVHQRYTDPYSEVGLAIDDQRIRGTDLYLSPRLRVPLWSGAFGGLVADQRLEWIEVDERGPTADVSGDARRTRQAWGIGAQLEQFAFDDRIRLVPVVRLDGLRSQFAVPTGDGETNDQGRNTTTLGFAPRLGAQVQMWPGVELRASAGRYFRPPTLTELFGDRGYVVGNEGLRPERGYAVDGGVVIDQHFAGLAIYSQLAAFASWSEDLIQWVNAGAVSRPINLMGARLSGIESSVALVPPNRGLTLHANYTWLDSRNLTPNPAQQGKALPGRPRHELFVRATAGRRIRIGSTLIEPRVLYTVDIITGTVLDLSERFRLPPRILQGLGAELHLDQRVHFAVELRNIVDVRSATVVLQGVSRARPRSVGITDFIGYPLAGRSVWATIGIELKELRL